MSPWLLHNRCLPSAHASGSRSRPRPAPRVPCLRQNRRPHDRPRLQGSNPLDTRHLAADRRRDAAELRIRPPPPFQPVYLAHLAAARRGDAPKAASTTTATAMTLTPASGLHPGTRRTTRLSQKQSVIVSIAKPRSCGAPRSMAASSMYMYCSCWTVQLEEFWLRT